MPAPILRTLLAFAAREERQDLAIAQTPEDMGHSSLFERDTPRRSALLDQILAPQAGS
jgi:hypothetical protein